MSPNLTPPVPRNQNTPTVSELIPFKSKKIDIKNSKALIPLMLVGFTVLVLFFAAGNPYLYIDIVAFSAMLGLFLGIYYYSGIAKAWWLYLIPALVTWFLLAQCLSIFIFVFRVILPGGNVGVAIGQPASIMNFVSALFGAGLMEELLKATPVLCALVLTIRLGGVPSEPPISVADIWQKRWSGGSLLRSLALRGPLDGMMMGLAAGAAFILFETLVQYVPDAVDKHLAAGHGEGLAYYFGLTLLLPRVFSGVSGHMGWAAIFGYFIGLAAKYPSRWLKLISIGYLVAAVLHACWDTNVLAPIPESWGGETYATVPWRGIVTIATVLLLVACLLKAKQLELAWGSLSTSNDSILVGGPTPATLTPVHASAADVVAATPSPAQTVGGFLSGLQGVANTLEAVAGGFIKPVAAPPPPSAASAVPAPQVAAPAQPGRFSIGTSTARYGLDVGHAVDFGQLFGVPGAIGQVSQHPSDPTVLGLKNIGASAWTTATPDGATVTVPPGKNLRVAAGTRLMFGSTVIDMQPY